MPMTVEEAEAFLAKAKEPTGAELLEGFVDNRTDDQIFEESRSMNPLVSDPPSFEKILSKALESIVLIDGLPKNVGKDKIDRLKEHVTKKMTEKAMERGLTLKFEEKADRKDVKKPKDKSDTTLVVTAHYPFNEETGLLEEYALFKLENEQKASQFQQIFNKYRLTKKDMFSTYNLSHIEKYKNVPEEWTPPKIVDKVFHEDLENYLNEENDQFVVLHSSDKTEVCLNQPNKSSTGPDSIMLRAGFADCSWPSVKWSPKGTYLMVFDPQERGVGLFGGDNFNCKEKIKNPCSFNGMFSPDERYVLLQSGKVDGDGHFIHDEEYSDIKPKISVWDLTDNEEKKKFIFPIGMYCANAWERFQWSHDGRYLGTYKSNHLCIFDAWNNFKQINEVEGNPSGEHIFVPGLRDYSFSPTDPYVCYWVPEEGERPLRVVIRELPSLKQVRVKNLFNVKELEMLWHPQGNYLALKCNKKVKGKKDILHTSFEVFHIKEKEIPVDIIEIKDEVPPTGFAWEPQGNRLAVMYGPNENNTKTQIRFFQLTLGGKVKELPLTEKSAGYNHMFWCPTGRYIVFAHIKKGTGGGALEWMDVDGEGFADGNQYRKKKGKDDILPKPVSLNTTSHQFITDIEWDTSGRFVTTFVSAFEHRMENGYILWNFQGKDLFSKKIELFCLFRWRPRPKSTLTAEQLKKIGQNMSTYTKQFAEMDLLKQGEVSMEDQKRLQGLMADWNNFKRSNSHYAERQRQYLNELYGDGHENDGIETVEVKNLLKTTNSVVSKEKIF